MNAIFFKTTIQLKIKRPYFFVEDESEGRVDGDLTSVQLDGVQKNCWSFCRPTVNDIVFPLFPLLSPAR